jgi:hypothetical protein
MLYDSCNEELKKSFEKPMENQYFIKVVLVNMMKKTN